MPLTTTNPSRISEAEALDLIRHASTPELMARADALRRARHGQKTYFVHSYNLNPTNRCVVGCNLCSFWRKEEDSDAYLLSLSATEKILKKLQNKGLTDLHIVGGMLPELDVAYYEQLFSTAKKMLPSVLLQGMTAVEIHWIAEQSNLSVRELLIRLKEAGMGSLSGGGAEIFDPQIRQKIAEKKIDAETWLEVHRTAHQLGIPTNATMLFGHIENETHWVDHWSRIRALQDETNGFHAFIPLPFQANAKSLGVRFSPSGDRQVRVAALSRIFLDNVPHIRMLVNYMDRKLLGVLAHSGVDDIGGTSLKEQVAVAAGAPKTRRFSEPSEMVDFIKNHRLEPILTNSVYQKIPASFSSKSPDLSSWKPLLKKAEVGGRLSAEEALLLYQNAPFQELGRAALHRRQQLLPTQTATYILDKNLNTTNVCETACRFCAFYADPDEPHGYLLSPKKVLHQAQQAADAGATQILLQGGLNPKIDLNYYETCFQLIRENTPLWIHSLSPTEIEFLAQKEQISIRDCILRLKNAGLQSIPGGGAEILVDEIRQQISPKKTTSSNWLQIMQTAHEQGLKTTATMVYGFGETLLQRIEHWMKIRDLQDRTAGFTAFIPWSFSPVPDLPAPRLQTGVDYLRLMAMARLVLDNIPHLQAGWVTEGASLAQLALNFGADDFGGILMTEEVVTATGLDLPGVNEPLVRHLIQEAGWKPQQRTTQYEIF